MLRLLRQPPNVVRLCLHGHVHANTLTTRHGIAFVTNAAAGEYPMQWREVAVSPSCVVKSMSAPYVSSSISTTAVWPFFDASMSADASGSSSYL